MFTHGAYVDCPHGEGEEESQCTAEIPALKAASRESPWELSEKRTGLRGGSRTGDCIWGKEERALTVSVHHHSFHLKIFCSTPLCFFFSTFKGEERTDPCLSFVELRGLC